MKKIVNQNNIMQEQMMGKMMKQNKMIPKVEKQINNHM
jgi:hypothetical protein